MLRSDTFFSARSPIPEFRHIHNVIHRFKNGEMIIIVDHENRENEGDLCAAGACITPTIVNDMTIHGRGLIFCPISSKVAQRLQLSPQVDRPNALNGTNFTVSVDALKNTTTGISASDRAETIARLSDPASTPEDFARPGHIFPVVADDGGTLARPGHTEAIIELTNIAQLVPVGVGCEIIGATGAMANRRELARLGRKLHIEMISVEEIILYIKKYKDLN